MKSERGFWQQDEEATDCPECGDTFTFLLRKHHCRVCGYIYDNKCAPVRDGTEADGRYSGLRVCIQCWRTVIAQATYAKYRHETAKAQRLGSRRGALVPPEDRRAPEDDDEDEEEEEDDGEDTNEYGDDDGDGEEVGDGASEATGSVAHRVPGGVRNAMPRNPPGRARAAAANGRASAATLGGVAAEAYDDASADRRVNAALRVPNDEVDETASMASARHRRHPSSSAGPSRLPNVGIVADIVGDLLHRLRQQGEAMARLQDEHDQLREQHSTLVERMHLAARTIMSDAASEHAVDPITRLLVASAAMDQLDDESAELELPMRPRDMQLGPFAFGLGFTGRAGAVPDQGPINPRLQAIQQHTGIEHTHSMSSVSDHGDISSAADAAVSAYMSRASRPSLTGGSSATDSTRSGATDRHRGAPPHTCGVTFDFTVYGAVPDCGLEFVPASTFHRAASAGGLSRPAAGSVADGGDLEATPRIGTDLEAMGLSYRNPASDAHVVAPYSVAIGKLHPSIGTSGTTESPAQSHNRNVQYTCCRRLRPGLLLTHINGVSMAGKPVGVVMDTLSRARAPSRTAPVRLTFLYHPMAVLQRAYDVLNGRYHIRTAQADAACAALTMTLRKSSEATKSLENKLRVLARAYREQQRDSSTLRAELSRVRAEIENLLLTKRELELRLQYAAGSSGPMGHKTEVARKMMAAAMALKSMGGKGTQAASTTPAEPSYPPPSSIATTTPATDASRENAVAKPAPVARDWRTAMMMGDMTSLLKTAQQLVRVGPAADPLYPSRFIAPSSTAEDRKALAQTEASSSAFQSGPDSAQQLLEYLSKLSSSSAAVKHALDAVLGPDVLAADERRRAPALAAHAAHKHHMASKDPLALLAPWDTPTSSLPQPPSPVEAPMSGTVSSSLALTKAAGAPSAGAVASKPNSLALMATHLAGPADAAIQGYRLLAAFMQRDAAMHLAEQAVARAQRAEATVETLQEALTHTKHDVETAHDRLDALERALLECGSSALGGPHSNRASLSLSGQAGTTSPARPGQRTTNGALMASVVSTRAVVPSARPTTSAVADAASATRGSDGAARSNYGPVTARAPPPVDALSLWERYKLLHQRASIQQEAYMQRTQELHECKERLQQLFDENMRLKTGQGSGKLPAQAASAKAPARPVPAPPPGKPASAAVSSRKPVATVTVGGISCPITGVQLGGTKVALTDRLAEVEQTAHSDSTGSSGADSQPAGAPAAASSNGFFRTVKKIGATTKTLGEAVPDLIEATVPAFLDVLTPRPPTEKRFTFETGTAAQDTATTDGRSTHTESNSSSGEMDQSQLRAGAVARSTNPFDDAPAAVKPSSTMPAGSKNPFDDAPTASTELKPVAPGNPFSSPPPAAASSPAPAAGDAVRAADASADTGAASAPSSSLPAEPDLPLDFALGKRALLSLGDGEYPGGQLADGDECVVLCGDMHKRSRDGKARSKWSNWEFRFVAIAYGNCLYFKSAYDSRPQKQFFLTAITAVRSVPEGEGAPGPAAAKANTIEVSLGAAKIYQFALKDAAARAMWYGLFGAVAKLNEFKRRLRDEPRAE